MPDLPPGKYKEVTPGIEAVFFSLGHIVTLADPLWPVGSWFRSALEFASEIEFGVVPLLSSVVA